jgi:uncharacterized protein YbjT (DUF2867 family)
MILVTGATGTTGRAIVRRLSSHGTPTRALVRPGSDVGDLASLPHVAIVRGDMAKPDTLSEPLRGVERAMLISSSDPSMFEVQASFVGAAKAAGVRHVVKLSGIMPAVDSPFRFARMHGLAERRLEETGLAYTHLRAGEFMTSYFRQVRNIVERGVLVLPMADAKIACLDIDDLADVAVHVLLTPGHENVVYPLTGPEALTMSEVAAKLSEVTGKAVRYVNVDPEEARKAQLAAGVPAYTADALFELFAERRTGKESTVYPTVAKLLGRPAGAFDAFAQRNAAIFRGEAPAPKV